jgi:hypothetical protein
VRRGQAPSSAGNTDVNADSCPSCGGNGINGWAWIYAAWPFHATCSLCKAKVRRRRHSIWLDLLCQPIASLLILFAGFQAYFSGGSFWIAWFAFSLGLLLLFVPYMLGKFVVVKASSHAAS